VVESPVYDCKACEKVPCIDATAVLGDDGGVTIFAVNRSMTDDIVLTADLRAFGELKMIEHIQLHHDDVKAVNTEECPQKVYPVMKPNVQPDAGHLEVQLDALSWNVIRLGRK